MDYLVLFGIMMFITQYTLETNGGCRYMVNLIHGSSSKNDYQLSKTLPGPIRAENREAREGYTC